MTSVVQPENDSDIAQHDHLTNGSVHSASECERSSLDCANSDGQVATDPAPPLVVKSEETDGAEAAVDPTMDSELPSTYTNGQSADVDGTADEVQIKVEVVADEDDVVKMAKPDPTVTIDGKTEKRTTVKKEKVIEEKKKKTKGKRVKVKEEEEEAENKEQEELPKKVKKTGKAVSKKRKAEEPAKVAGKKPKKEAKKVAVDKKKPGKKAKQETEHEVWRWWEEEKKDNSVKWSFLEHKGPVFAPEYEPLPENIKFYYDGKPIQLSTLTEEVATFYGKMLDHEYTTKDVFNKNFFHDWRKVMKPAERELITDLKLCNFREICDYFLEKSEQRKAMSKEEKQVQKEIVEKQRLEYGMAVIDGHKEKIGNFKIEPPGLFRGRGVHPKMGKLKRRIMPEDVIINCSKDSKIPQPPPNHQWKEVRHDNTVTWLASWTENIMGSNKYVMLNPSSKIKGEKDWEKYEIARKLKRFVEEIRSNYRIDWKSKETRIRQRAVALYFIDRLALRAGHEKEENESADTVGCCSLRCEHIKLHDDLDGQQYVVEFDFLGKDSIRYYNRVPVEKRVFKNLKIFMENKTPEDELFDRLNSSGLNKHLQSLMDGLTAKVFRTFNASITLQDQLNKLSRDNQNLAEKLLTYNRANRQVAILCNHQRSVSKAHGQQMENMQKKIAEKEAQIKEAKKDLKSAKAAHKAEGSAKSKSLLTKKENAVRRFEEQLIKLKVKATDKEENKEIALGTSKLNYLDPRITVAWCKKNDVPIEKVYNKTQREKFQWAVDMAGPDFVF